MYIGPYILTYELALNLLFFSSMIILCICLMIIVPLINKIKKIEIKKTDAKAKTAMFKTKWFSLVKEGHYFYIDYGKESSGVVVLAIVDYKEILMVKNHRFPIHQDSWELPRGFIDEGENFIQAALRELLEETGYQGQEEKCSQIGFVAPDTSILNNKVPVILVQLKSEDKTDRELDKEISESVSVPMTDLNAWMKEKGVVDSLTFSSLYLYDSYL